MANDLTNFTPELWSKRVQRLLERANVAREVTNMEERSGLRFGDRVHRPYHSEVYAADYTKGTAYTVIDVSTTDEYLDIDQAKVSPVYIDKIDDIQNMYSTMDLLSRRTAFELSATIDRAVTGQFSNAALSLSSTTLSTSNAVQTFSNAKAALFSNGCEMDDTVAVIDPDTASIIEQTFVGSGFNTADITLKNGYAGSFLGVNFYVSPNIKYTTVGTFTGSPSDADTFTHQGVVFTFKTALTPTAGEVLIGVSQDTALSNLAAAINGSAGAGTTYVALSAANRATLTRRGSVAVADTGANTLTVTTYGNPGAAESTANYTQATTKMPVVMRRGAIDLVVQKEVGTEFKDVSGKLGTDIVSWTLYGVKTFTEGAQRMYKMTLTA